MGGETIKEQHPVRDLAVAGAILAAGVAVRLIGIGEPFVDHWSWRQSDVAMIAENFYRHGHRILYPQINWAGRAPGYVGTEFQLVPFLASLVYGLTGVRDWVGRALSVAFFAGSVPCYYALVTKIFGSRAAVFAAGLYALAPLCVFAGRAFMPDMASLSFSIAALWFFAVWLDAPGVWRLGAATACAALAVLVKLPAIVIGAPCLYLAWRRYGPGLLRRPALWGAVALVLGAAAAWYLHAYRLGASNDPYDVWILGSGFALLPLDDYGGVVTGALFSGVTPVVAILMLLGGWSAARDAREAPYRLVFHWWLAAIALFLFVASNRSLQHWYALPVVAPASALAGAALARIPGPGVRLRSALAALAVVGCVAATAWLSYRYASAWYAPRAMPLWTAGMAVQRLTPPDALVVFVDDGDPAGIYYGERRGWHFLTRGRWAGYPSESAQAIADLEALRGRGAAFLVFPRSSFWWLRYYHGFSRYLEARYPLLAQSRDYLIFDLRRPRTPPALDAGAAGTGPRACADEPRSSCLDRRAGVEPKSGPAESGRAAANPGGGGVPQG